MSYGNFKIKWDSYFPAEAENEKFVILDPSSFTDFPTACKGKTALLTYNVSNPVATIVDTTFIASSTVPASTVYFINCPNISGVFKDIEIYNNSNNTAYFLITGNIDFSTLKSQGLILNGMSFYSISRDINTFCVASDSSIDLRIIGHYSAN